MSNKNETVKKLLGNRIFISLLVLAVVVVTFSAIGRRPSETVVTEYKPVKEQEVQTSTTVTEHEPKPVEDTEDKPEPEEEKEPVSYKLPLQGELQRGYFTEELMWDPTMEDWRTHQGVDIASQAGDEVDTAAPGTVIEARADAMHGYVVRVEHIDGVVTVYKNLAKTVVAEGDTLDEGQMIGTVGEAAPFEMSQTAHLHFEVLVNNECVNPLDFIK